MTPTEILDEVLRIAAMALPFLVIAFWVGYDMGFKRGCNLPDRKQKIKRP